MPSAEDVWQVGRWVRGGLAKVCKSCCGERGKENREMKNDLPAATEGQAEVGDRESEIAPFLCRWFPSASSSCPGEGQRRLAGPWFWDEFGWVGVGAAGLSMDHPRGLPVSAAPTH